jgi:dUTP pyrophosphatase
VEIKIKVTKYGSAPVRAHATDAGADLVSKENILLTRNVRTLVPTGVHVEIPPGYVGLLFPRSSLSKRKIVMTNSVGVIDSDYRGEIMASLMYLGELNKVQIQIDAGERIVQLVIVPIVLAKFIEVDELDNTARGSGGFGSTG